MGEKRWWQAYASGLNVCEDAWWSDLPDIGVGEWEDGVDGDAGSGGGGDVGGGGDGWRGDGRVKHIFGV